MLPMRLVPKVLHSVEVVCKPFWQRFSTVRASRDALAEDDTWCFGGSMSWLSVLAHDIALDDLAHFSQWMRRLLPHHKEDAAKAFDEWQG